MKKNIWDILSIAVLVILFIVFIIPFLSQQVNTIGFTNTAEYAILIVF